MSKTLTSVQAVELAEEFAEAAQQLRAWRLSNKAKITKAENDRLRTATVSLTMMAEMVATEAVGLALDEATVTLAGLESATARAKKAIKNVQTAKKAIEIGAATVSLAAAVVSKDPAGVLGSMQALVTAVGDLRGSKKATAKKATAKKKTARRRGEKAPPRVSGAAPL